MCHPVNWPIPPVSSVATVSALLVPQLQTGPEYGQGMNPISRLAQIQQAKKEREPEYTLLMERGLPRRREFVIQVGWCGCG